MYRFFILFLPMALSFAVQSLLCRRGKSRLIRNGLIFLLLVPLAVGIVLLAVNDGDMFGGLGVLGSLLWMIVSASALCGYGFAWLLFFLFKQKT